MEAGHKNAPGAQASQSGIYSNKQEETLGRQQIMLSSDLHTRILYVCAHTYTWTRACVWHTQRQGGRKLKKKVMETLPIISSKPITNGFNTTFNYLTLKLSGTGLPPHSRPRSMWQAWQMLWNDTSQAWLQHPCLLILISSSKVMNIFSPLSPSTLWADLGHVASSWPKYFIHQGSTLTYRLNVVHVTFQESFWIHYPNWQMICKHQKAVCQQLYL